MFRKILTTNIVFILLLTTTGISMSKHYCGNHLRSVTLINIPDSCCDSDSCCHTETYFFQLDDDFTFTPVEYIKIKILPRPFFHEEFTQLTTQYTSPEVFGNFYKRTRPPGGREYLSRIQSFLL